MKLPERRVRLSITVFWMMAAILGFVLDNDLARPLSTWDEEIYFNVARNVLDGRWLIPELSLASHPLGVIDPYLHKPPLAYWIQAGAMGVGGETPAVARLPSLIAMSGVVGVTVLLACRLSRPATGVLAGGLLTFTPALSVTHGAVSVATDPFLLLFGFTAVYCLVLYVEVGAERWAWIAGVGYGAAILTKQVAAAPFGLFVLGYLYRYRGQVGWRGFGRVVAGGVVTVAPWFLVAALVEFRELVDQMFLNQALGRATGEKYAGGDGLIRYPYLRNVRGYFGWPMMGLPLAALVTGVRERLVGQLSDVDVLMWPLGVGVVGTYLFVGNHPWYIMPAAIPIAILSADALVTCLTPILDNFEREGSESRTHK